LLLTIIVESNEKSLIRMLRLFAYYILMGNIICSRWHCAWIFFLILQCCSVFQLSILLFVSMFTICSIKLIYYERVNLKNAFVQHNFLCCRCAYVSSFESNDTIFLCCKYTYIAIINKVLFEWGKSMFGVV
jgi:hypothetical protein